jgi:hypothetical protein
VSTKSNKQALPDEACVLQRNWPGCSRPWRSLSSLAVIEVIARTPYSDWVAGAEAFGRHLSQLAGQAAPRGRDR